jgi:hypothetical protein
MIYMPLEHGKELMERFPADYLSKFYEYFYKSRTNNFYNKLEQLINISPIKPSQTKENPLTILSELFKDSKSVTEKTIKNWENRMTIPNRGNILELAIHLKIGINATDELLQLARHLPLHSRDIIWDERIDSYVVCDICYYVCLHYQQSFSMVQEMMKNLTFSEDKFINAPQLPPTENVKRYTTQHIASLLIQTDQFNIIASIRQIKKMIGHFQQSRGHINKVILRALNRDENNDIDDETLKLIRKKLKVFFVFEHKSREDVADSDYILEYCAYQTTIKTNEKEIEAPRLDQKLKPLISDSINDKSIRSKGYPSDMRELLILILIACYYPELGYDGDNPFAELAADINYKLDECGFLRLNYNIPFDNFILKLIYDACKFYDISDKSNEYLKNHLKHIFNQLIEPFRETKLYPLKLNRSDNDDDKESYLIPNEKPLINYRKEVFKYLKNFKGDNDD